MQVFVRVRGDLFRDADTPMPQRIGGCPQVPRLPFRSMKNNHQKHKMELYVRLRVNFHHMTVLYKSTIIS